MFRFLLLRLIHAKISRPNTTTQMAITVNSIFAPRVLLNPDSPEGSEDSRKKVARQLHANLNSRSETGDRVGSFFYPTNVVHVYKPPGVSKKHCIS
jgi:hypothetical protein